MTTLRTPLARVRGLGSAKDGTAHWYAQRVTALALVPLTLWFVVNVVRLIGAPQLAVAQWIGSPLNAALMLALVVAVLHHAQLGMQVVIEDYVHSEGLKLAALLIVKGLYWLMGTAAVVAIFKISVLVVLFREG